MKLELEIEKQRIINNCVYSVYCALGKITTEIINKTDIEFLENAIKIHVGCIELNKKEIKDMQKSKQDFFLNIALILSRKKLKKHSIDISDEELTQKIKLAMLIYKE